ncbi:hypothetical protein chiPu_0023334 [Chiloscyllium punctatum]|uniref:Uncharacterized protein n=1 Tax=Chiloscyllium punctatum TaxID=137246 RepID=A0A401T8J8_CHIPU|nr:hypothetical protein [Chiloscyllium punctatum]
MRRFLDHREQELKKELAEQAGAGLQPLEDNLRSIQQALISIQKDIIACQAAANQRDSLQFLQVCTGQPYWDWHTPPSTVPALGTGHCASSLGDGHPDSSVQGLAPARTCRVLLNQPQRGLPRSPQD